MQWIHSISLAAAIPMVAAMAIVLAMVLTVVFLLDIGEWKSRRRRNSLPSSTCRAEISQLPTRLSGRPRPHVTARVEAVRSLSVEGSFKAIRISLRNHGETRTTVEEIILLRRPDWFEFGLVGPLVRLSGQLLWRLNVGFASRKTVGLPVTLDVNGYWESLIPLEPSDPNDKEEIRQLEKFSEKAVNVLRSGGMRYSIQLSCPAEPGHSSLRQDVAGTVDCEQPRTLDRGLIPLTCRNLDGRVSVA